MLKNNLFEDLFQLKSLTMKKLHLDVLSAEALLGFSDSKQLGVFLKFPGGFAKQLHSLPSQNRQDEER